MKAICTWFKNVFSKIRDFFKKMDNSIDKLFKKFPKSIKNFFYEHRYLAFLIVITIVIVIMKYFLVPQISGDYYNFIQRWTLYIGENGGFVKGVVSIYENADNLKITSGEFAGIQVWNCDYPPLYMYMLSFISILPKGDLNPLTGNNWGWVGYYENWIYLVKTISFIFEIIFAIYAYKIVKKVTNNKIAASCAYSIVMILPTVVVNSSIWGQCDVCYAAMVLATIYYALDKKYVRSMIFFGLGFAFKMQTIFILPLFGFLWFRKSFKIRYLLIMFLTLFITFVPLWCAGAQFVTPFMPYGRQIGGYVDRINLNSTNIYTFFNLDTRANKDAVKILSMFGMGLTVAVSLITISVLAFKKVKVTPKSIFTISAFLLMIVPFVMPHMHDRYFYLAETFFVLYACVNVKRIFMPILSQIAGIISYLCYGYGIIKVDWLSNKTDQQFWLCFGTCLNMVSIAFLIYDLTKLEVEDDTPIAEISAEHELNCENPENLNIEVEEN